MKPTKYVSREGLKAYGYEGYFKVTSVKLVTAMLDSKSKQGQDRRFTNPQENRRRAVEEEQQAELSSRIVGKTLGYTRDGRVYMGQEMKREYTY